MRVPLVDLGPHLDALGDEIEAAVERVLHSGRFILGPEVEAFEAAAASYLGTRYAVGVSSGSDALLMALMALDIGAGDEVITTPFTFFATVEAILRVGAVPRFADIDERTFNVDPSAIANAIGKRTRAIVAVHLFGRPAPVGDISTLAERHGIPVIEDAAQAFGIRHEGRAVGTWGALGCFSFFPTKPLGACGDAGMLATNDEKLAERCRRIRQHGATSAHAHAERGGNFRLDAMQAAILSTKLPHLGRWLSERRAHATAYDDVLGSIRQIIVPAPAPEPERPAAIYTIRVPPERRAELATFLRCREIQSAVYYPTPAHLQPALRGYETHGALAASERVANEVLSLPLYPELRIEQRQFVIDSIREFFSD